MITKVQQNSIRINIADRGIMTIDLEAEMVDHISSAVEDRMEGGMSFRDAYKATIIEFGPQGLEYLQQDKNKALIKKGLRLIAHKFVEITTPPKVFISLLVSVLVYFIISLSPDRILVFDIIFYGTLLSSLGIFGMFFYKNIRIRFSQINAFSSIFFLCFQLMNILNIVILSDKRLALYSDLFLSSIIMFSGLLFTSFFMVLISVNGELKQEYESYIIDRQKHIIYNDFIPSKK